MSRLSRRSALLLPFAASGCAYIDDLLATSKDPLPGRREAVTLSRRGLEIDASDRRPVAIPAETPNADWVQPGRVAAHVGGNLASSGLSRAWRSSIGDGGGYRRKITATPVVAGGRVFTMDSDAVVAAFDLGGGGRAWRTVTQDDEDRSTNVGGGIAVDGGTVYATTGRADILALDAATGAIRWRKPLGTPARTAPTVADGRLYVTTIDDRLVALSASSGDRLWSYQAATSATTILGRPAPAVADGLVVAGFGSGEISAVRSDSGAVAWTDSMASTRGRNSLLDLSAVRGLPAIEAGRVYAVGLGGVTVSFDLRSGRRLWEREIGGSESPWLAGDWLFVLTTEQALVCLSKDDGRVRWFTDLPRYEDMKRQKDPIVWTGPVMAGGRLLVGGSTEKAMTLDPASGQVQSTFDLPGIASVPAVVAGGTVLMVTDDASLSALR